jgi:hypothetical protein
MYYFDNEFLKQYFDQGVDLKVIVGGEIYSVTSKDDIQDPVHGVGTDPSGETHTFNYKDIIRIKAGETDLGIDQLQDQPPPEEEMPGEEPAGEEPAGDAGGGEEDLELPKGTPGSDEEKAPKESKISKDLGKLLIEIKKKSSPYYGLKGILLETIEDGIQVRTLNSSATWRWGDVINIFAGDVK